MNQTFMKEKKVIPLVFSMSMPMVLSMLVNSLFNIVDSYFVAKVSESCHDSPVTGLPGTACSNGSLRRLRSRNQRIDRLFIWEQLRRTRLISQRHLEQRSAYCTVFSLP